ncbi:hypothetical protein FPQ18DRAFT_391321 [Pyronema domesticum]|nr:hypothetical protein FPQ18DRAFT_391321 [Pyronema domesticum]
MQQSDFNKGLSYVNNAMIHPIAAGLMDDLSAETYDVFSRNEQNEQATQRRMKDVGLWSLQLLAQAFLMAMAGSVA